MNSEELKEYFRSIGKKGGEATKQRGSDYFKEISKIAALKRKAIATGDEELMKKFEKEQLRYKRRTIQTKRNNDK